MNHLETKRREFHKKEAPFIDKISGLVKIKMLDMKAHNTMMLKLTFIHNLATLDVINSSLETVIFYLKEMLGILDLRSMGYYKIKQGILQQNLSKYFRFKSADTLCEQFDKFINTLKKEKDEVKEKYPWLQPDDEGRNISDRVILDKCVDLDKPLSDTEKKQVIDISQH